MKIFLLQVIGAPNLDREFKIAWQTIQEWANLVEEFMEGILNLFRYSNLNINTPILSLNGSSDLAKADINFLFRK